MPGSVSDSVGRSFRLQVGPAATGRAVVRPVGANCRPARAPGARADTERLPMRSGMNFLASSLSRATAKCSAATSKAIRNNSSTVWHCSSHGGGGTDAARRNTRHMNFTPHVHADSPGCPRNSSKDQVTSRMSGTQRASKESISWATHGLTARRPFTPQTLTDRRKACVASTTQARISAHGGRPYRNQPNALPAPPPLVPWVRHAHRWGRHAQLPYQHAAPPRAPFGLQVHPARGCKVLPDATNAARSSARQQPPKDFRHPNMITGVPTDFAGIGQHVCGHTAFHQAEVCDLRAVVAHAFDDFCRNGNLSPLRLYAVDDNAEHGPLWPPRVGGSDTLSSAADRPPQRSLGHKHGEFGPFCER